MQITAISFLDVLIFHLLCLADRGYRCSQDGADDYMGSAIIADLRENTEKCILSQVLGLYMRRSVMSRNLNLLDNRGGLRKYVIEMEVESW